MKMIMRQWRCPMSIKNVVPHFRGTRSADVMSLLWSKHQWLSASWIKTDISNSTGFAGSSCWSRGKVYCHFRYDGNDVVMCSRWLR